MLLAIWTIFLTCTLLNSQVHSAMHGANLINHFSSGMDSNFLTGQIPASIGSLTFLSELWLKNNSLEGTIPASISSLSNLHILYALLEPFPI